MIILKNIIKKILLPYKGALETWYYENKSFKIDIIIIFLTSWAIILFPEKKLHNIILKELPVDTKNMSGVDK